MKFAPLLAAALTLTACAPTLGAQAITRTTNLWGVDVTYTTVASAATRPCTVFVPAGETSDAALLTTRLATGAGRCLGTTLGTGPHTPDEFAQRYASAYIKACGYDTQTLGWTDGPKTCIPPHPRQAW